jgi:L-threonylcarbamoyladenylate synthase
LPELGPRTTSALEGLLPGPVTLLLPNPAHRFPLACGVGGRGIETLGLRVPALGPATVALGAVRWPVMQSSANPSGGADARRLSDIPAPIREAVDLVLDAGELDGTASTVVDLRRFEASGDWELVREGALARGCIAATLDGLSG